MRLYPYRTTTNEFEQAVTKVTEAGDAVIGADFVGGRDWLLTCRTGGPTIAELSREELVEAIAEGVERALKRRDRRARTQRGAGR